MIKPTKKSLPVLTEPNPSLRQKSEAVDIEKLKAGEFNNFFTQLHESMLEDDGIGIAAPQVGNNIRACYVSDAGKNPILLINPEITWFSKDTITLAEGCLSVPNVWGPVTRPKTIHVKALDESGDKRKIKAKGWLSRVIQHEIDHLDGILFIDKAESLTHSDEPQSKL